MPGWINPCYTTDNQPGQMGTFELPTGRRRSEGSAASGRWLYGLWPWGCASPIVCDVHSVTRARTLDACGTRGRPLPPCRDAGPAGVAVARRGRSRTARLELGGRGPRRPPVRSARRDRFITSRSTAYPAPQSPARPATSPARDATLADLGRRRRPSADTTSLAAANAKMTAIVEQEGLKLVL
jgi:hypothetical protein